MPDDPFDLKIQEYFRGVDSAGPREYDSETGPRGIFVPSNLEHTSVALETLIERGIINPRRPFVDLSSGDGRVAIQANAVYGLMTIAIEESKALIAESIGHWQNLQGGIVSIIPLVFVEGDFSKDATYAQAGIKFEDVGTFFNFSTKDYELIADQVADRSPPGTVFMLYSFGANKLQNPALKLVKQFEFEKGFDGHPTKATLDVYKKKKQIRNPFRR